LSAAGAQRDLVVLVADKNMEAGFKALLERHRSFGIRPITADTFVHPERDPGCFRKAHDFLRPLTAQFAHALVAFDRQGCGHDTASALELESAVEGRLSSGGWDARGAAVVLDPEFEIWVWSDSPAVDRALGWAGRLPDLRTWLAGHDPAWLGLVQGPRRGKPARPKEALEEALHLAQKPRSSARYAELARHVGLERCTDRAFLKLRAVLAAWFAPAGS
jgi:hypothetical protein